MYYIEKIKSLKNLSQIVAQKFAIAALLQLFCYLDWLMIFTLWNAEKNIRQFWNFHINVIHRYESCKIVFFHYYSKSLNYTIFYCSISTATANIFTNPVINAPLRRDLKWKTETVLVTSCVQQSSTKGSRKTVSNTEIYYQTR